LGEVKLVLGKASPQMRLTFTSSPLSLVESFSGKRDNALGRLILDVEVLREVAEMATRWNTIGIRIALEEQVTSVDIILMKMLTASILFHLFGAHGLHHR
jgi:hypothetical protein